MFGVDVAPGCMVAGNTVPRFCRLTQLLVPLQGSTSCLLLDLKVANLEISQEDTGLSSQSR